MRLRLRRPSIIVTAAFTSIVLAAGVVPAAGQDEVLLEAPMRGTDDPQPATGLIVQFDEDVSADPEDLVEDVAEELPDGLEITEAEAGPEDLALLSLSDEVDATELDEAIDELEARPDVAWAIPNGIRFPQATANDPFYTSHQWNLRGTWGVRADRAWDVTTGRPSVRVAVIDTGILKSHPDLKGRLAKGRDFVDRDYRCLNATCTKTRSTGTFRSAGDGNGWDSNPADPGDWRTASTCRHLGPEFGPSTSSWHGTHVAGIIAATRNNRLGIAGIAPGVKVQAVRALGRCGGSDWDIAMSIVWASGAKVRAYDKKHGKIKVNPKPSQVINLSLGSSVNTAAHAAKICRFYAKFAAVARKRGATLVAAAGNNYGNHALNVPSSCPGYIAVAATTTTGAKAPFSNQGKGIDVAAPGVDIPSTYNTGARGPSTHAWALMSGTSMAAPAVSATAALAYSVGISHPVVVERVLKATARRAGGCSVAQCGAGVVDADAVVRVAAPLTAPKIVGTPRPGRTARSTLGRWRNASAVRLTWYRGSKAVAQGTTYTPTRADLGRRLTVRAVATGSTSRPGIYHESSKVVKAATRTSAKMPKRVSKSKRAKVTVRVASSYGRPTGKIIVRDGKKRIKVVKIKAKHRGKITFRLPTIAKKGKHRIRIVYGGNGKLSKSSVVKKIRVR